MILNSSTQSRPGSWSWPNHRGRVGGLENAQKWPIYSDRGAYCTIGTERVVNHFAWFGCHRFQFLIIGRKIVILSRLKLRSDFCRQHTIITHNKGQENTLLISLPALSSFLTGYYKGSGLSTDPSAYPVQSPVEPFASLQVVVRHTSIKIFLPIYNKP